MEAITGSFAYRIPNGKRRESLKPILFSCSISLLDDHHLHKGQSEKDMLVVKVYIGYPNMALTVTPTPHWCS